MDGLSRPPAPRPEQALVLFGAVFIAYHLGGALLVPALGAWTSPVLEWLLLAGPVLITLRAARLPAAATLRLRSVGWRLWAGTVALTVGIVGAASLWMAAQEALLGGFEFYRQRLAFWERALTAESPRECAFLVFAIVLTPAVCEELMFRGLLLRSLAVHMTRPGACAVVGLMFGLFHGDPLQMAPGALIGAVIAWLALVADSLLPAVLFHLLFNSATLIAHALFPEASAAFSALDLALSALTAAVFVPLALWLLRPRRPPRPEALPRDAAASISSPGVNP